jgi:hypothetical protein
MVTHHVRFSCVLDAVLISTAADRYQKGVICNAAAEGVCPGCDDLASRLFCPLPNCWHGGWIYACVGPQKKAEREQRLKTHIAVSQPLLHSIWVMLHQTEHNQDNSLGVSSIQAICETALSRFHGTEPKVSHAVAHINLS